MATNFKGYLLKAVATNTIFPHQYMALNTWKSTPNQREEIKAYRDENTRDLTRVTAQGRKSVFSFETRENLTLEEKMEIQSFFTSAESDTDQRAIELQFWNDEDNDYDTGTFYRPNCQFPIKLIRDDNIVYGKIKIEGIEY